MTLRRGALRLLGAAVCTAAVLPAQTNVFASKVVAFDDKGRAGGGIFKPANMLGRPDGAVSSLGIGGWAVLGFDVVLSDGPGADLIVTENPFFSGGPGKSFAEMVFVEVSSDGKSFARFPSAYFGPAKSPGPFGVVNVGTYEGMAGATPRNAGATDPQDVVDAGGDALDLADLADHPLVKSGKVVLQAIRRVRLVDVRNGVDKDSRGRTIFDPGGGSADVDAVTAVHHTGNLTRHHPRVDVVVPRDGAVEITVADPDGLADLVPSSLRASLWGREIGFADLLPFMRLVRADANSFELELIGTLPPKLLLRVSVSVKDRAGHRSGDTRSRPTS